MRCNCHRVDHPITMWWCPTHGMTTFAQRARRTAWLQLTVVILAVAAAVALWMSVSSPVR